MVYLDVIRHARTRWNLEKRLQGSNDIELCRKGIADANHWAVLLAESGYDRIVSSPLKRAINTAEIIADAVKKKIVIDPHFREQDFGLWEGKTVQHLRETYPGQVEAEESKGWLFHPPQGESRQMVLQRVLSGISNLRKQYDQQRLLVVSHSSVMKILICHSLDRAYLPEEKPKLKHLIKPYHLHRFAWSKEKLNLDSNGLNAMDLRIPEG